MSKIPICEAADFINGRAFKPSEWSTAGLPIIRIQNLTGTNEAFNFFGGKISPKNVVRRGDILISWSASLGVYRWMYNDAALNQHIFKVVLKPGVFSGYFYYVATHALSQMVARVHGSTMQHITKDRFDAIPISLPSEPEQKQIAALLEKADRLRRTRRYARQLSDTFLQSAFLEMFGDPALNPKGWAKGYLGEVIHSAQDGPHVSPRYSSDGIPFLSTRHIRPGEINWSDLKYISIEDAKEHWRKIKPEKGDVLYTKGGTTGLAKAIDFDREVAVWVHIAVLKLRKDKVLPVWLENMLNSPFCYRQSQQLTFGIVNRDLGLKRMPRIRIYIPPLPVQHNFADIVHRFERLRAQQREAERQTEHLFQTLLHRAFSIVE
jgi:type I restriction enzyme, S subunit